MKYNKTKQMNEHQTEKIVEFLSSNQNLDFDQLGGILNIPPEVVQKMTISWGLYHNLQYIADDLKPYPEIQIP